jgi:protein-tyrosine-phosphatase
MSEIRLSTAVKSRRWLLGAIIAISGGVVAKSPDRKISRVLFVCQAGTVKSPIARELFRKKAVKRGIRIKSFSRGVAVEDHVTPELRQRLVADGIETRTELAQQLSSGDLKRADIVIGFNPLPAEVRALDIRDWTDVPSVVNDYDNALAVMNSRIDLLLDELEAGSRKPERP